MDIKKLLPLVVVLALAAGAVVLVCRLISGAMGLVAGLFNAVLGLAVVVALILLVLWMFRYAKKK